MVNKRLKYAIIICMLYCFLIVATSVNLNSGVLLLQGDFKSRTDCQVAAVTLIHNNKLQEHFDDVAYGCF